MFREIWAYINKQTHRSVSIAQKLKSSQISFDGIKHGNRNDNHSVTRIIKNKQNQNNVYKHKSFNNNISFIF